MTKIIARSAVTALAALLVLAVAGCAPSADGSPAPAISTPVASEVVTVEDAWVKTAEEGMTAGFGVFTNSGDQDITVVAVTTDAASMSELHETVEDESGAMVMRPVDGGFVLPARSDFVLEPAGNHLMMMDLAAPLAAGGEIRFTLEFSDGSTLDFTAVVKDYAGANENYVGGDEMDMGGDE